MKQKRAQKREKYPPEGWRESNPNFKVSKPHVDRRNGMLWVDACGLFGLLDPADRERFK